MLACRYVGLWTSGGLYGIWYALAGTIVLTVRLLLGPGLDLGSGFRV